MANPNPPISLYLDGNLSFQLHRPGLAGNHPTLKIQMHDTTNAATLVIPGYQPSTKSFSLPLALQGSVFDIFDTDIGTKVYIPSKEEEPGELIVKAGARNQWFDLKIDPREAFWTNLFLPGHKYEIRWADGGKALCAHRNAASQETRERLPVRLLPRPIKLTVFDDASAPPQFSLSLSPTAEICHLSGEPKFGFKLDVVSLEKDVITVCLHKTPLKELHGLEEVARVIDEETDEEVEWPYGIGCFEGTGPFPFDDMFEDFKPGVPYERTFWLEKYDARTSNGGELNALEAKSKYKGEVSKTLLGAFSKWRRGRKEELLAGGEVEKKERWSGSSGRIVLEVSEPFTFETM